MPTIRGKTVFITGASAGIGGACARVFAMEGCRLILAARRLERLNSLSGILADELGAEVFPISLDVRDRGRVERVLDDIPEEWKGIDVLVNNAGLGRGLDKLHEGDVDGWEEMVDTNVKGLLYMTRALVPGMVERGSGHVINVGSVAGRETYPGGGVYCATKFAVKALTRSLRMDLLGTPIRVSTVDPGLVETEFSVVRFHGDAAKAKKVYEGLTPLTPEDIAEAIVWVASRPPHVDVTEMVIMPTAQASALLSHRGKAGD